MPRFLFQPYSIDGYEFNPIPIDIHLGILKIRTEEILDDFGINTTESVIVGTDRLEVLNRIQSTFAREFEHMKNLKNQIFGLWIIKPDKDGRGLESTLRIQIRFKSGNRLKTAITSNYYKARLPQGT